MRRGFTLIELLLAIVIFLGILTAVVYNFNNFSEKSRYFEARDNLKSFLINLKHQAAFRQREFELTFDENYNMYSSLEDVYPLEIVTNDLKILEDYFSKEENIEHMPMLVQDSLRYCDLTYNPTNKNSIIMIIDKNALKYITDVIEQYNIIYEIKDLTKSVYFGEYPFELDSEFKEKIDDIVLNLISVDDILEKIHNKGIKALSQKELVLLNQ